MNQGRTVFAQLIAFLPDREFRRCVTRYDGDTRLRGFSCWDQPRLLNPPGLAASPNYSQAVLVGPIRLAFTGSQMAFGYQAGDARLAFQRLEKALGGLRSSLRDAVWISYYPLSAPTAEMIRKVRLDFLDPSTPPAATMAPFQGLPSLDASFAVEAIARVAQ
jgi:enamine deaminase RidA (YjgF/YER057c/UK114 family)